MGPVFLCTQTTSDATSGNPFKVGERFQDTNLHGVKTLWGNITASRGVRAFPFSF